MHNTRILNVIALILLASLLFSACAPTSPTPLQEESSAAEMEVQPADTSIPNNPPPEATPTSEPSPTPEPASQAMTLTDGLGREVVLEGPAQTIVSLAPSNTEILFALGAGDQVIGRDAFSDYPEAAQSVTDIGGGWGELDTETIVSLAPDLVLASELSPPEQVQALEELGLTIFYLSNPTTLEEMYDNLRTVAKLSSHEKQAEELIGDLAARVASVQERIAMVEERPLVFYELDGTDPNAPWTSGAGTFIDTLLDMAGGDNLGNVLEGSWAQISVEELVAQDPDIILLGDYTWGGVTPEDVASRAGWEALTAVQAGEIYPFNDNLVSRPGPRLVDGLEGLAELLHPDLFE